MREPRPKPSSPYLPPPPPRTDTLASGLVRPTTAPGMATSTVHFLVHPAMKELLAYAAERGWFAQGFTALTIPWQELHWTADGWKTVQVLRSTDVPCPVVNGFFYLPSCPAGTEVEFAVHVGVACHAPQDTAGVRDTGELWFNHGGKNYRQTSR